MLTFAVHLVVTPEDKARAEAIRKSEEELRGKPRTPQFIRDGSGLCRTIGDPDDFTRMERRSNEDYAARARAAAVCQACPFSAECLVWAKETGQSGVFGAEWLFAGVPQPGRR